MSIPTLNSSVIFYTKANKTGLRYWYILVIACTIITIYFLLALLPFHDYSSLLFFLLYIGVSIFGLAKFYRTWRITRLIIYSWGIEYYAMNFQLTSSWDDLGLAKNRTFLTLFTPALFTPIRLTMKKPVVKRNLLFDWDIDILYGNARYFVPMSPRIWDSYNELVGQIKQYRPDLLLEQKT